MAGATLGGQGGAAAADGSCADTLARLEHEETFVNNWLGDLFAAMDAELDEPKRAALLAACGRACYHRHTFKQEIAARGRGNVDALVAAYAERFEAWRDGDTFHIRYGAVSKGCYCPAASHRPARPNDMHCECTRATHRAVAEAALGRPCPVDVVETVRRGGRTCHFIVRTA